jgi:hypothetical protein
MFVPHRKYTYGPPQPLTGDRFNFVYVNDVRTSQEIRPWTSTACYGDSFTFVYVNYVRTSHETPVDLHGLLRG